MRDTLRALRAIHLAPARTAHAWFDGTAGASAGTATATPPVPAGDPAPPAPAPATPPPADPAPAAGDGELHALRTKAGRLEAELKKLQEAEKARQEADLSEVEKLKRQIAERDALLEQQVAAAKAGRLAGASLAAAARLGFADPEDAQRFLDAERVEWDDATGAPKNVQQLLEAVLKAKPYLKASFTATPDLGQGNRGAGTAPLTRDAIAKLSPAEINARWPEVSAVLNKG